MAHRNSKKITILRKGTFAESAQVNAAEFMSMSKKSIGPYWESKSAKGIGSGLSFAEKDMLMPRIIDIPKEDRNFMPDVKKFFESLTTPIPYLDGLQLEIGLELDNNELITFRNENGELNWPINVMDYIRYRHALSSPKVAPSLAAAKGNVLVDYYIFDPAETLADEIKVSETKDRALTMYLTIKNDKERVDKLLTLLGKDPRDIGGSSDRIEELRRLADTQAASFIREYDSELSDEKYLLTSLINTGLVRQVGNQYINAETQKLIGSNKEEAMFYFKDPVNSDKVSILKAQLHEAMKKETTKKKNRIPVSAKV